MRTLAITLFAGLLLSGIACAQAATIYKWTDNQGQVHFGSQPPAGYASERITTRSSNTRFFSEPASKQGTGQGVGESQKEIDARVKRKVAQEQAELQAFCTGMRTRLAQLKNNPRLFTEIDGETVHMDEEERQRRIRETEDKISEFCN